MTTLLVLLANLSPVAHISFHNGIFTDLTSAFLGSHLSFFIVLDFVSWPSKCDLLEVDLLPGDTYPGSRVPFLKYRGWNRVHGLIKLPRRTVFSFSRCLATRCRRFAANHQELVACVQPPLPPLIKNRRRGPSPIFTEGRGGLYTVKYLPSKRYKSKFLI